ncbi:VOC family protein [Lentzea sp.]|uniref:VOC family protein n=1 Tax=Lentzea sp. TaxID=56099 RepID=UPI002ED05049
MLSVHHVGVQTDDFENCLNWYLDFFEAKQMWELDRFSRLTLRRLPGIRRLTEVSVGDVRFHLFDRATHTGRTALPDDFQFQHVCLAVGDADELPRIRLRWVRLYQSGRYRFALPDPPTEIITDADGVQSLYLFDVNGLELEFTHLPGDTADA